MNKSQRDIDEQAARIILMAEESHRFRGVKNKICKQTIYKLARTAKSQHGFSIFDKDKETKRECERPFVNRTGKRLAWWQQDEWVNRKPIENKAKQKQKPLTADERLELEKTLNDYCNHEMINKVLAWIAKDMMLKTKLGLPGDPFEVPKLLRNECNRILDKLPIQQKLF